MDQSLLHAGGKITCINISEFHACSGYLFMHHLKWVELYYIKPLKCLKKSVLKMFLAIRFKYVFKHQLKQMVQM